MRQDTHSLTTSSEEVKQMTRHGRQKEVKLASDRGGGLFGSEVLRGGVCRCRAPRVVIGWEKTDSGARRALCLKSLNLAIIQGLMLVRGSGPALPPAVLEVVWALNAGAVDAGTPGLACRAWAGLGWGPSRPWQG